ncbi:laccase-like multicopper oxidase [Venturia nashicola]|uniref:Laccase-like multicopper oxidase n=1 Tax=Venturia nashicola TaxID=86259 RepID=A0A4Z1P2F1_9PEZI|nr:laccase-like multicopper oxidase [Venturia nashicola]TLD27867.1 laccase-like multicopper oxidase [Venturia nashicola]
MKLTGVLPLIPATIARVTTPINHHNMAGAISAGLGGSKSNDNPPSSDSKPSPALNGNSPNNRSHWGQYNIDTDYEKIVPETGVTREYWLDLIQVTLSPDGVPRTVLTVNGTMPGPTLTADWGDFIIVHVRNSLFESQNGTSIHWHGIRQLGTPQMDGVSSVTQCPTAPGEIYTYSFRATQYGSSWYHSHFGLQTWEGVFGGLIINGPATADYDEDLGNLFLQDWSHQSVDALYREHALTGNTIMDNGLINGTNVYGNNATGQRFSINFVEGTSYRLRLVNVAVESHFKFSIDNHTMTVIEADWVPIVPYTTTTLNIATGQRYDVIIKADQGAIATDFWMRAIPQFACSPNSSKNNIKGVVHYGSSSETPTTTGYSYTDECVDEPYDKLVPQVRQTVGPSSISEVKDVSAIKNAKGLFRWTVGGTSMNIEWGNPTFSQLLENSHTTFTNTSNAIELPNGNQWVYVLITTRIPVPHPMHMHGHDILVLAQGTGDYSSSVPLKLDNPPRRDVVLLPAHGYLVIAFETNNPGAWVLHCHIGWHVMEGFALQFIERPAEIPALLNTEILNSTCASWNSYSKTKSIKQTDDSGL